MTEQSLCNATKVIEPATDLSPEIYYSCGRPENHGNSAGDSSIAKVHIAYGDHRQVVCVWRDEEA